MVRTLIAALALVVLAAPTWAADLPNPTTTPGAIRPEITADDLCPVAHTGKVRNVPQSLKNAVYAAYGMAGNHTGYCDIDQGCEVDHLVSLELGGSNDITNLWPQPYSGTVWNAHVKDLYENFLHKQVCVGALTLEQAQWEISSDWIAGYRTHPELPLPDAP